MPTGGITITGRDGSTVTSDASWEEAFPYGTFAFADSQVTVEEGGSSQKILVYRLGGTTGRATVSIMYMPAYAEIAEGEYTYASAAGKRNITIAVEDPLPIAKYQPLGAPPEPSEPEVPTDIEVTDNGDETYTLTPSVESAEKYQWYVWRNGRWSVVTGATERDFVVDLESHPGDEYDYMCVYTIDGVVYGSNSATGDVYVKPEEDLGEEIDEHDYAALLMQEMKQSFSILPMDSPDEYSGYMFDMTFADGEWVKEITLTAPNNDITEPDKFGTFTMTGCLGGSLYDSANTLVMQILESGAAEPTTLGFETPDIRVDKTQGSAFLSIKRTGGTSYPVSLKWNTVDGTAIAGEDYLYSEGNLIFFGDVDEVEIEIPLIDDGVVSSEDRIFFVELSDLRGGGDGLATFDESLAVVFLHNSGKRQATPNLATQLYDAESVDVSGSITEGQASLVGAERVAVGTQVERDRSVQALTGTITWSSDDDGELAPLSHEYGRLTFLRAFIGNYDTRYWKDWLAQEDPYSRLSGRDINGVGRLTWMNHLGPSPQVITGSQTFGIYSNDSAWSALLIPNMHQLYSEYQYSFWGQHRMNYGKSYVLWPRFSAYPPSLNTSIHPTDTQYAEDVMDHYYYMAFDSNASGSVQLDISTRGNATMDLWLSEFSYNGKMKGYKPPKQGENYTTEGYAEAALRYLAFKRRVLSRNLQLRIYTANDADVAYENGLPANVTIVPPNSGLYSSLKPMVSIKEGQGGVDQYGHLYVGSTLEVSTAGSAGFKHVQPSNLGASVYLTRRNSDGTETVVATGKTTGNADVRELQLLWSNITAADLNADYVINVVLDRTQDIILDLQPSVPRQSNGLDIDPARIPEAYTMLTESNKGSGITVNRADVKTISSTPDSVTGDIVQSTKFGAVTETVALQDLGKMERNDTDVILARGVKNLYSVNLNLSEDDVILFEGTLYKGNETIQIPLSALSRSQLSFKYYNKDYMTALSVMTAKVSDVCLYLDANGNGKIDGYFDKDLKVFMVDETKDKKVGYLPPGAYEETIFAPVWQEDLGRYVDHFIGIEYTMTPRCLVVPPGGSEGDRAQVLTVMTTGATDPGWLANLSKEQKDYRYVKSGELITRENQEGGGVKETTQTYCADNHLIYGAEAEALNMVYFSAGGDRSPAERANRNSPNWPYYTWDPDFHGSLMYDFENPGPVTIPAHVSGNYVPIAKCAGVNKDGVYLYEAGGLAKVNNYLGSLSGVDTFAVAVQQQPVAEDGALMDSSALMAAKKTPVPEASGRSGISLFPNGDYLCQMETGAKPSPTDMDSGDKGDYGEFGLDMGVELPNIEIGLSDYLTIIMDGYDIGFAIGLPLGGFETKRTGGFEEAEFSNPKTANEENVEKFRNFFTGKWGQLTSDDSLKSALDEKANPSGEKVDGKNQIDPGEMSSSNMSVSFTMGLGFIFSYSPVTDQYHFSKFAISIAGAFEYQYQYRFTPVPIVYVYVKIGISLELATGLKVVQNVVEHSIGRFDLANSFTYPRPDGPRPKGNWLPAGDGITSAAQNTLEFSADHRIYNVYFKGKILVEIWDSAANEGAGGWGSAGYITSSDTGKPVMLILAKQKEYSLAPPLGIRFTSMENDTMITQLIPVEKAQRDTYWNGMCLAPSAFIEAGAGVGVELLKFELFAKLAVSMGMTFGPYNEEKQKYDPFSFDEFELTLGIGFRVVALFFNIEKEAIQYILNYEKRRSGANEAPWMHGYSSLGAFGQMYPLEDEDSTPVAVSLPKTNYRTQRIFGPAGEGDFDPLAYDTAAPFQISGYHSSGDAFTLASGLTTGYSYQVVTVGDDNYLFYTVSRDDAGIESTVDSSMLVMSKIKVTGDGASYGLVHPVPEAPGSYVVVDDDDTGDLEFKAWADGNEIHIIWTSYATKTKEPEEPDSSVYARPLGTDSSKTSMDIDNYRDADLFPIPAQPEPMTEPDDGADETAWEEYRKYVAEQAAYDAYAAWTTYFSLLDNYVRTLMAVSAKNTVVKTASFDTFAPTDFTPAKIVGGDGIESGDSIGHVFLPEGAGDGSVLFYASTNHFADGGEAANRDYEAYLMSIYGDEDSVSYKNVGAFLLEYQTAQNALYGEKSTINIVSAGSDSLVTTSVSLTKDTATPRTIENLEMAEINGVYYLAYTTVEESYTQDIPDILYTRRLFLRTVIVGENGKATFGDPYLLRTLVNYDQTNNRDGVYSGGVITAYEDPYFANLQFLSAKLGALDGVVEEFSPLENAAETFLLFEMNGNTYVIPQADLRTITEGDAEGRHFGRIIPFFTKEIYTSRDGAGNTVETESSTTGYTDVTVGADSAGNIAAVYTAMVPGSTNNAIYITEYYTYEDEEDGLTKCGWSTGQILAMKDMQVYEDSITYGWDAEATEAAYLEGITGDPDTTKASQFRFGNLQFALGTGEKALVIAEGTLTELMNKTYTHPATRESVIAVVPAGDSEVGFYAVAFGQGQQAIGNTNITLSGGSFKAGSHLKTSISFDNVGNTRIRGSESQPITVELLHHSSGSADEAVATWKVIQSITPGQKVSLVGLAELRRDAEPGDYFYFRVAEDQEYAGQSLGSPGTPPGEEDVIDADALVPQGTGAFSAVSTVTGDASSGNYPIGRYIVQDLPDLGFESMVVKTVGVTAAGDTILEADFYVSNRGTTDATGVFAQFSYQTGVDSKGDPTYAALDLTGSSFRIFNQTNISDFGTLGETELQNGILRLVSTEDPSDGDNIAVGYGRQVSGTFYAPPENYYLDPATGTKLLKIRVEVFSAGDQTALNLMDGLYTASGPSGHNEPYSLDNEDEAKLGHQTYFSTAHRIAIPMGNTLLLPIAIATTRDEAPVITVTEHRNHDIEGNIPNSLGVLYYDANIKCIVMVPSREGNGIVRVSDTMTGCSLDIAFTVTEATMGINIYDDNDMFTFYNRNDTEYDPDKTGNDWSFVDAPEWGANRDVPYLTNLSKGEKGAYFTFDTVASAIDIYFSGQISVDSTYAGFGGVTGLTATGGNAVSDARKVTFGDNSEFFTHTVTITVESQTPTMFDKYVETYAGTVTPKPADDAVSPQVYWSRSFPDVASMDSGTVKITCYIIDDTGLASVTLDRVTPALTKSTDNRFWQFDWEATGNGAHTVQAADIGGNTTSITINAGWFNDPVTPGAIATAPFLDAEFQVDGNLWDGNVIPRNKAITLISNAAEGSTVKMERFVYTCDPDDNTKVISAGFAQIAEASSVTITSNGIYRVTATLPDGTWSSRILYMTGVDAALPAVSLTPATITIGDSRVPALSYSVAKDAAGAASLQSATINGDTVPVSGRRATGTWLPPGGVLFNGTYTLVATDTAGNSNSASVTISFIEVDGSNAINVTGAYNQARDNGSVVIDKDQVTGGMFVVMPQQTRYFGSYEYSLLPAIDAFVYQDTTEMTAEELAAYNMAMSEYFEGLPWDPLTGEAEKTSLIPGEHVLYIRDAQDPTNTGIIYRQFITIADEAITFETYTAITSGVSAKDGSVSVEALGGKGGNDTYQFAIAPLTDKDLLAIDSDQLVWVTADNANLSLARVTFEGLGTGRYQIAVRGMYGVTAAQMQELHTKRDMLSIASASCKSAVAQKDLLTKAKVAYDAAAKALVDDSTGDPDGSLAAARDRAESELLGLIRNTLGKAGGDPVTVEGDYGHALSAADAAIAVAESNRNKVESDYDSCVTAANDAVELVYLRDPTLWDNAFTQSVYVGYAEYEEDLSGILLVTYDPATGRAVFTLTSAGAKLSAGDQARIRAENRNNEVILRANGLTIVIPAGTLRAGDNVNDLIPDLRGMIGGSGWVVAYTDADGNDHIVPWSQVTDCEVIFMVTSAGRYKLVLNSKRFRDVNGHWAEKYIEFIAARELFVGTGNGMFSPDIPMTRAMFVTVLGRLMGVIESEYAGTVFDDVPTGTWYSAYVRWASEKGIVGGYGHGRFGPDDPITREQMCAMLFRFCEQQGITLPENEAEEFGDADSISSWAAGAVAYCQRVGLIQGVGDNRVDPLGLATRAQVATIYMRMILSILSR